MTQPLAPRTSPRPSSPRRAMSIGVALLAGAALALLAGGCSPPRQVSTPRLDITDVPPILRGTIGAEAAIRGTEPILVSGVGVVVGLAGTGGGEYPQSVIAHMEREVARNGIGKGGVAVGDLEGVTPLQFLRSPNVAIVIVQAVIAPGAPKGSEFDVYVSTLSTSSVTSLEGGTLWTVDLRIGQPSLVGGMRTRKLAIARGPIFINPFSEPAGGLSGESVGLTRTRGRVLAGGVVTDPLKLQLVLDDESHSRARTIVNAVNSRFPRGPGDDDPTARGRGSDGPAGAKYQSITINVPRAFADEPAEFLQLLRYTRVDQSFPQEFARLYVDEMKSNPAMASDMSWCLQAIGRTALPFLLPMYDYPEAGPRMAALEAGAKLGDPRAVPHLVRLTGTAPPALRAQAISLLAKMPHNPSIDIALREFLSAPELDVRVAAYEALSGRRDFTIGRHAVGPDFRQPKFFIETVAAPDPMIYVTQQGQPRIVLFGDPSEGIRFVKPTFVSMWSDRLLFAADDSAGKVRMRYLNTRTGRALERDAPEDAYALIRFLAHRPTPEDPSPGLDMTYSEVVGALYELTRQGGFNAMFATEEDRLRAAVLQAGRTASMADRPETTEGDDSDFILFKPDFSGDRPRDAQPTDPAAPAEPRSKIIPLNRPNKPAPSGN